jgi:predicted nucleic acid-binding Zn ribbon protein
MRPPEPVLCRACGEYTDFANLPNVTDARPDNCPKCGAPYKNEPEEQVGYEVDGDATPN